MPHFTHVINRFLYGSASCDELGEVTTVDTLSTCNLGNRCMATAIRKVHIATRIVGLNVVVSPMAVTWFVVAVVVLAINCGARRSLTHVSQEVFEPFPSLAYLYSAPAPVRISRMGRVSASLSHILPRSISAANNSVLRVTVASIQGAYAFSMEAPTTRRSSRDQSCRRDNFFNSAVASTQPTSSAPVGMCEAQAHETSESFLRSIDNFSHRWVM